MSTKPYPSTMQDKFVLRLPDGMRDRIRVEAEKNGRSMNSEVIARLEASLSASDAEPGQQSLEEKVEELELKLEFMITNHQVLSEHVKREFAALKAKHLDRG